MTKTAIFLAKGFEEIEALMVVDLLRRAEIQVDMVSISDTKEVEGAHDIVVMADVIMDEIDFDSYDLLVLPGGMLGTIRLGECKPLGEELIKANANGKKLAAICAAPTVLGQLGLLKDKKACCYPGMEDKLDAKEATTHPVTVDGNITTSRGLGTALPFAISLIGQFQGKEAADAMAQKVVYF